MPWIEDVTLEGASVRLAPMTLDHVDALCAVGLDPAIWQWMPAKVRDRAGMAAFVESCVAARDAGTALPFVTVVRDSALVVGATRFMNMVPADLRVEIGGTWIAPAWQRTRVNSEAKYLMLGHAFDQWGCRRVEFKTSARNDRSRSRSCVSARRRRARCESTWCRRTDRRATACISASSMTNGRR